MAPAPAVAATSPPSPPPTPPLTVNKDPELRLSPARLTRKRSRPTVMDVAQALNEKSCEATPSPPEKPRPVQQSSALNTQASSGAAQNKQLDADPGGWEKTVTPAMIQAERRKANAEKYSGIIMPVLTEVKTPEQSPANTLTKADAADPTRKGSSLKGNVQTTTSSR